VKDMELGKLSYKVLRVGMITSTVFLLISIGCNVLNFKSYSDAFSLLGLGILIATPYIMVCSIIWYSIKEGEKKLLLTSSVVLIVMMASLAVGLVFHIAPTG